MEIIHSHCSTSCKLPAQHQTTGEVPVNVEDPVQDQVLENDQKPPNNTADHTLTFFSVIVFFHTLFFFFTEQFLPHNTEK